MYHFESLKSRGAVTDHKEKPFYGTEIIRRREEESEGNIVAVPTRAL